MIYLKEMLDDIDRYNQPGQYWLVWFRQTWIDKITLPLLSSKVSKMLKKTVDELYNHPDHMIMILGFYISYIIDYCKIFGLSTTNLLDAIFDPGVISLTINHSEPNENDEYNITHYNLVVRATIPINLLDNEFDKFSITSIEVDIPTMSFTTRQVCYMTAKEEEVPTSKIVYDKVFVLDKDGKFSSPNYYISNGLLQTDMDHYRIIIAQLMIFMGGLLESTMNTVTMIQPDQ